MSDQCAPLLLDEQRLATVVEHEGRLAKLRRSLMQVIGGSRS
jgi:hypothetical protein